MVNRWLLATVAALVLLLAWQNWTGVQQRRHLEEAARTQLLMANSAIFDANWALQQVQDPAAPESEALIRQAAEGLIIARERLNALREAAFRPVFPFEDANELAERVHVVAGGLQYAVHSREWERFKGYRNFLRVMTEHLPFPNQDRNLKAFSQGVARIRATGREEGFTLNAIPSVPPAMQLTVAGLHWPVKRGGYCWQEAGGIRCIDMASPADLVAETSPPTIAPSADAQLRFAWPADPGSVKLWRLTGGQGKAPVSVGPDLTFTLPQESGTHVYWAEAGWEQGNGTYAFKVTIK